MKRAVAVLLAASALAPRDASAHGETTAYLEIVESAGCPGEAIAVFKLPTASREARPVFPAECDVRAEDAAARSQRLATYHVRCPGSLHGRAIAVTGMGLSVTSTVVRVLLADGSSQSQILRGERDSVTISLRGDAVEVFARYVGLGVRHIASGVDHLLFVLGLLFLARSRRHVLVTTGAFTLAHSVTLAATTLGWLRVSSAAAEACIALSLVLVALEIGARRASSVSLAFAFGLVHGLGFAGALAEVGLPERAIPTALFAFNVGVEIGQLAFVAACAVVAASVTRLLPRHRASLPALVASYVMGCVGIYLLLSRLQEIVREV